MDFALSQKEQIRDFRMAIWLWPGPYRPFARKWEKDENDPQNLLAQNCRAWFFGGFTMSRGRRRAPD